MHMMKTRNCSLEINSCGLDIDIAGIYIFVIRFLVEISDQTINYVISRNPEKLTCTCVLSLKNSIHRKFPTILTFVKNISSKILYPLNSGLVSTFPTSKAISWAMKSNDYMFHGPLI